ncbi:hypothetical protein DPMN_104187 [Dreissena polymorpha]|uniref:GHMP kinase C-terminal domain-containing protein n=1 Tax=Dreissena polymorpha TaxID=45954 RepID=A0A9D4JZU7_DREPO|nr:hypothetical protein DPMN_104187 [Dreissena polymorpha]
MYSVAIQGDLESVGQSMDEYWVLKKTMAAGCEPEFVARLMNSMRPYALGMCMAGAGVGVSCMCWPVTMRHRRTSRTYSTLQRCSNRIEPCSGKRGPNACG